MIYTACRSFSPFDLCRSVQSLMLLLACAVASISHADTVIGDYPLPSGYSGPISETYHMATGGGRNTIWFPLKDRYGILYVGRADLEGNIAYKELPFAIERDRDLATGIAVDTSGYAWTAVTTGDYYAPNPKVIRLHPESLEATYYELLDAPFDTYIGDLVATADGAVWIAGRGGLVRITAAGDVSAYPFSGTASTPGALFQGADENLWVCFQDEAKLIRVNPTTRVMTEFSAANGGILPYSHCRAAGVGPDGNIWITGPTAAVPGSIYMRMGRVAHDGTVLSFFDYSNLQMPFLMDMVRSPNGKFMYVSLYRTVPWLLGEGALGKFDANGGVSMPQISFLNTVHVQPTGYAADSEGMLWSISPAGLRRFSPSDVHNIVMTPEGGNGGGGDEELPPEFTSDSRTIRAKRRKRVAINPSVSNSPTSFSASGLPKGLKLNTSSGAITGKPKRKGRTVSTITATNDAGTDSMSYVFVVR